MSVTNLMKPTFLLFFIFLVLIACGGGSDKTSVQVDPPLPPINTECDFDCFSGNGAVSRSEITYDDLQVAGIGRVVDFSAYSIPTNAANPVNNFEGRLQISAVELGWTSVRDSSGYSGLVDIKRLPDFDYQFFQHGTHLIPISRGLINTGHSIWQLILEPGRVWNENNDNGFSRASLPFALQEKGANCTHNGVLSFLFKNDGSMSTVSYQISSETCAYYQFDLYGQLSANYIPEVYSIVAQRKLEYENEISNRLPVKPLSELAVDFPNSNINVNVIASEISRENLSSFGVSYNGIHYAGNCVTRFGDYPYCDVMSLPSYSLAKSIYTGYGLMALEQEFPGSKALSIGNYVSECMGDQWLDVSFENALDMSTGNYSSTNFQADENSIAMAVGFFSVDTDSEKSAFSCAYQRNSNPNELWVYHTTDSYLLAKAMDQFLNEDSYQWLYQSIYQPLGVSPVMQDSVRTLDNEQQAYGGYGLTFHRDDILKIANFINIESGVMNGQQILDLGMVEQTLQRTDYHGLNVGSVNDWYDNGFWIWKADDFLNCSQELFIPYMSGFGGISVVLLPNNMTYYYFSDGGEFSFALTVRELSKISSICS